MLCLSMFDCTSTCLTDPSTVAGACNFHFCSPSTFLPPNGGDHFHNAISPMLVPPARSPTIQNLYKYTQMTWVSSLQKPAILFLQQFLNLQLLCYANIFF
jgi:hypothetical protein